MAGNSAFLCSVSRWQMAEETHERWLFMIIWLLLYTLPVSTTFDGLGKPEKKLQSQTPKKRFTAHCTTSLIDFATEGRSLMLFSSLVIASFAVLATNTKLNCYKRGVSFTCHHSLKKRVSTDIPCQNKIFLCAHRRSGAWLWKGSPSYPSNVLKIGVSRPFLLFLFFLLLLLLYWCTLQN